MSTDNLFSEVKSFTTAASALFLTTAQGFREISLKERDPKGLSKLYRKAIGIGVAGASAGVGAGLGSLGAGVGTGVGAKLGAKIGKALSGFVIKGIEKIFKVSHNNILEIPL